MRWLSDLVIHPADPASRPRAKRLYNLDFVIQLRELAEKTGVTANTVTRIENGADAKQSTMNRLQHALEIAGIEFIDENGGGAPSTKAEERLGSLIRHLGRTRA